MSKAQKRIEKNEARDFAAHIAAQSGRIFHFPENHNSIMILPNDKMGGFVRVHIAYCSLADTFKKRKGTLALQNRYEQGQYILVPFNEYHDVIANQFSDMVS